MIRRLLTWSLRRLAYALIPGWLDDGAPDDYRLRLIGWAWGEDDRAAMPEAAATAGIAAAKAESC